MKIVELKQQISRHSLEELQRSHYILEALMAGLSPHTRKELVSLLQTLSEGAASRESSDSIRQRALQIVSGICKPAPIPEQGHVRTTPREYQQRSGERRQHDRRQQPANSGKPWTTQQEQVLRTLAEQNVPARRIALKLGRTSTAIQSKAKEINVPLNPVKMSAT
ncbi:hypothetical protein [Nitrosospira sp. NpAV]|uniref:hypothetical protein n=1 Tax=Nitrosospira sp. NpAV TaxID=58133 RepID=UPI0012EBA839|nr:hypothetical protein [Nitrosospira sp. NpAV]